MDTDTKVQAAQLEPEDAPGEPAPGLTILDSAEKDVWPDGFALDIAHATRTWIQYGMLGFAVACIVIGAVKGILGF